MRHNNCLRRTLCTYYSYTNASILRTCNAMHMHAAMFVYVSAAETAPETICLVRQTQPQTCLWLTVNSFPKSRLFANINTFKLCDIPKSCLNAGGCAFFAGTSIGVQRGVRSQPVVRADGACVHRSVAHS